MIQFCKTWCEGIIVAVIISIIIESILPEGNHKKYVKVVIGIYIVFTILNPFLGKLNTEIKFENPFNMDTIQVSSPSTQDIQKVYASGIKETLKNKIEEEFGYLVTKLEIKYDEDYENIETIELHIQESKISQIEKVQIGNQTKPPENPNGKKVKQYIAQNYEIEESKITIY